MSLATDTQGPSSARRGTTNTDVFDLCAIGVIGLFVLGSYVDAYAHNHVPHLESFFTPWHAFLYGALLINLLFFSVAVLRRHHRGGGGSWLQAIPPGYGVSLFGLCTMIVAGIGDMCWHVLFGVEQSIDAVFSPTHLLAIVAACCLTLGPFQALTRRLRKGQTTRGTHLLFLLATAIWYLQLCNPLQIIHPLVHPEFFGQTEELLGILTLHLSAALFVGILLYVVRSQHTIPFGLACVLLASSSIVLSMMRFTFSLIPASIAAGLTLEAAALLLRPTPHRRRAMWLYTLLAALVPGSFLLASIHPAWSIHVLIGTSMSCGLMIGGGGYLLTFPGIHQEAEHTVSH